MMGISVAVLAAWANATLFAAGGIANVAAPERVRAIYGRWDAAPAFYRMLGILELAAAVCLVTPALRDWGIGLAAPIAFLCAAMMIDHGQRVWAASTVVMVASLFAALLATPQTPALLSSAY